AGSVTDDLWPNGSGQWTAGWIQVSGPATVTFGDASNLLSSATFSAPGQYTLRLNASDGTAFTSDDVQVTVLAPIANPPSAFDLSVAAVDARTAMVKLRTDQRAICSVEYGLTADFGLMTGDSAFGTNHSIALTNLQPAATYFFRVRCANGANDSSLTYTLSFGASPVAVMRWGAEVG